MGCCILLEALNFFFFFFFGGWEIFFGVEGRGDLFFQVVVVFFFGKSQIFLCPRHRYFVAMARKRGCAVFFGGLKFLRALGISLSGLCLGAALS